MELRYIIVKWLWNREIEHTVPQLLSKLIDPREAFYRLYHHPEHACRWKFPEEFWQSNYRAVLDARRLKEWLIRNDLAE